MAYRNNPSDRPAAADPVITEVVIAEAVFRQVCRAVWEAQASEVCGFLFGFASAHQACIQYARPAENIYHAKDAFAVSPIEHARAAEGTVDGMKLLGIYHHHFGPARPSRTDRGNMMLQPLLWLIVGRPERTLEETPEAAALEWQAFRRSGNGIRRLKIVFGA